MKSSLCLSKQEANRLNPTDSSGKDAIIAFMLYDAEGNIGQVKRSQTRSKPKPFTLSDAQGAGITDSYGRLYFASPKGSLKVKEQSDRLEQF